MIKCFFDYMNEVNVQVPSIEALDKKAVSVYYQHKEKPDETFTDLNEAYEGGLNLADFEKKTVPGYLRTKITDAIFEGLNDAEKVDAVLIARKFLKIMDEVSKPNWMEFEVIGLGEMSEAQKKHELFLAKKRKAFAKIQNVKNGTNKSCTLEQAQAELKAVYVKFDEVYVPKEKKVTEIPAIEGEIK